MSDRGSAARLWTRWIGAYGSVRVKLLGVVLVASLAVAGITLAALMLQWRSLDQAAQIEARNLAQSFARTVTISGKNQLDFVLGDENFDGRDIFLLDRHRMTLASILPEEVGTRYEDDKSTVIEEVLRDGQSRTLTEVSVQHPEGARLVVVPVRGAAPASTEIVGVLVLEYSRLAHQLIASNAPRLYGIAVTGLLLLLTISVFGTRLAQGLSNSIQALQEGVEAFTRGNLRIRLKATGSDEVANLSRAFNTMAGSLEQTTLDLRLESELSREAARTVEQLAFNDPVTGLGNRSSLSRLMMQKIAFAEASGRGFSLLMLGLDRFRLVNDTLGHAIGDELLRLLGERLQSAVGADHEIVRLSGDEFAVLLDAVEAPAVTALARRLIDLMGAPCRIRGNELRISASAGASIFPKDGSSESILMRHADIAMHKAKEDGGGVFALYREGLNGQSVERLAFEASLRQAVDNEELVVHYQPKVAAGTGVLEGVEALVRWEHPQLGSISPAKFIPVAEETGLIVPLGRWVMRQACQQLARWQQEGHRAIEMAINLSPAQFRDEALMSDIESILTETGVDPKWLEFEITESMLMQDPDRTMAALAALKDRGVRLAVDDFGTGYSSLAQLRRFPVDTLKIDRSFVRGLAEDADDRAIAQAIMQMARSLRLKVVAEGVETTAQREVLHAMGCDLLQGFLFSPAVAPDKINGMFDHVPEVPEVPEAQGASLPH